MVRLRINMTAKTTVSGGKRPRIDYVSNHGHGKTRDGDDKVNCKKFKEAALP